MAEFVEVMKQAKRMCASHGDGCRSCALENGTGQCPLVSHSDELVPMDWSINELPEIERIVMDWAEKNPEPRYPRWVDVLYELGVFRNEVRDGNVHTCCLTDRAYATIPADIADKLGIKPIGGGPMKTPEEEA